MGSHKINQFCCRLASAVNRSTGESFTAWPLEDRAPRMHWMAERSRLKDKKDGFKVSALTSPPTRLEPFSNAA